ncbi:MAG: amidohydrolase [Ruminococcaceae bacterium]|nr:amidohydrolase [Oscillospiraceae bacterium]
MPDCDILCTVMETMGRFCMTREQCKKQICDAIDRAADEIFAITEEILAHPEMGYREENTSALVRRTFDTLGIGCTYPHALTGVKGKLTGREHRANVCIMGELDALKCAGHPHAAADGTAHACGHHTQIAAMLGAAMGLIGVMNELDGDITFFAVPAEEFIDLEGRRALREEGKIRYFGGKQQLIAEGAFDDIDAAMMIHAQPDERAAKLYCRGHNLGFRAKTITFRGRAAHGSTPWDGTNALNAAALAILGIHSNRETFRDEEHIRIHPIITKGGDVVNSVPDEVCIDTYVRGAALDAIRKGNDAVNRSVSGAAQMIGAEVDWEDLAGYLPIAESEALSAVLEKNAAGLIGRENLVFGETITGSTDVGDLSMLLPVIQPSMGGFTGNLHSREFGVADPVSAILLPAKMMAMTAADLLWDGAAGVKAVMDAFVPGLTKEEYIRYLEGEI